VAAKVGEQSKAAEDAGVADKMAWPALLRKLDRIDPSFRT
jgi:hypothetical protein